MSPHWGDICGIAGMRSNLGGLFVFWVAALFGSTGGPYSIQFSLSETKIIQEILPKSQDFASMVPGEMSTYVYSEESEYYGDYQKSYFAITCKRAGWDCLRHYEILANGCIPYFIDLENCHPETMAFLPKDLILEAMQLPGVSYRKIDHSRFDKTRYYEILNELLRITRTHLTSKNMAAYLLKAVDYSGEGKILFLSNDAAPDYLRCCTLIGLKEYLGDRVVDFPKIEHIYKSYSGDVKQLYGKGFSYTKIVEDLPVDRTDVEERIRNRDFDLVIYGSVHRGLRFHPLVSRVYEPNQIVYLCGEDQHLCKYSQVHNLFLREFDSLLFRFEPPGWVE